MINILNGAASVKPQSRITWGSTVATGFDRLKIGFYVKWESESFLTQLDIAKSDAKEQNDVQPVSFSDSGDLVFNCHATGRSGGFAFHLSRCDVHLFFSKRKDFDTPNVWIDIGSESCWSPGYRVVVDELKRMIQDQGGFILKDQISEVHLCADFIGLDIEELPIDNESNWITRANNYGSFKVCHKMSGITLSQDEGDLPEKQIFVESGMTFGKGDIMLRIYDKTLELKKNISKQSLFASVWNKSEYNEEPVTRVEYQLRKAVLKQMNVRTFSELEENKTELWAYCTQKWTRLSLFEIDRQNRHQDRAIIHPWWQEVQEVKILGCGEPIKREHARSSKDMAPLVDMMAGCAMTIGTILDRGVQDIEGVIAFGQGCLENKIRSLWRDKDDKGRNEFEKRMKKRWSQVWPMGFESVPV